MLLWYIIQVLLLNFGAKIWSCPIPNSIQQSLIYFIITYRKKQFLWEFWSSKVQNLGMISFVLEQSHLLLEDCMVFLWSCKFKERERKKKIKTTNQTTINNKKNLFKQFLFVCFSTTLQTQFINNLTTHWDTIVSMEAMITLIDKNMEDVCKKVLFLKVK